jgi:hypothetical protein
MISFLTSNKVVMLIDEDTTKAVEVNPDALEAVFEEDLTEEEVVIFSGDPDEIDEIDLAFRANDEGYW